MKSVNELDTVKNREGYVYSSFWEGFKENLKEAVHWPLIILSVISVILIIMWLAGKASIWEPAGTITSIILVSFIETKILMKKQKDMPGT